MELYEALEAATQSARRVVAGIRPDQYASATPCKEWDVRAVTNHVLGSLKLGAGLLSDSAPEVDITPGGLPAVDLVGNDPLKEFDRGAEALLALAKQPDAFGKSHQTPYGEMPGAMVTGFATLDLAVHGWDLAKATGQKASIDETLAGHIMGFAQTTLVPGHRPPSIGAPVAAPGGASTTDQLVAFLGRQP